MSPMSNNEADGLLQDAFGRLLTAAIADIKRHVATLRESETAFYGYAALPPDYLTEFQPCRLNATFNREADIDESRRDPYYRYSVDEWNNYIHDEFDATNTELRALLSKFEELGEKPESSGEKANFIASVNQTIFDALISLRNDGTFVGVSYIVIWIPDSDDEIVNRSVRELCAANVYSEYASEFS